MSKYSVYAWLNDLQMSAQLVKLAILNSYNLNFVEDDSIVSKNKIPTVLIVDLTGFSKKDLNNLSIFNKTKLLTIIGYLDQVEAPNVKYYKDYGCHMVIGRKELMKSLNPILKKIFHGD